MSGCVASDTASKVRQCTVHLCGKRSSFWQIISCDESDIRFPRLPSSHAACLAQETAKKRPGPST